MPDNSLRNLDLNLLVMLDALLAERNVTRAALRLGMSQPAVSAGLRRLRRHFRDELLTRTGNRYELSPLAIRLVEPVGVAVTGVRRVFDASPVFDPAASDREFTVIASDYAIAVAGELLTTKMADVAPGVRLRFRMQSHAAVDEAPESLRSVDGMVLPHGFLSAVPCAELYADEWVLLASADNDELGDHPSLDEIRGLPWVITHNERTAFTPAARQLNMIGVKPRVAVVVESFLPVPFMVAGTGRIALLQKRIAAKLADASGVRMLPCPWDVVPVKEAFWWHPSHHTDPGHAWLRGLLTEVAADLSV